MQTRKTLTATSMLAVALALVISSESTQAQAQTYPTDTTHIYLDWDDIWPESDPVSDEEKKTIKKIKKCRYKLKNNGAVSMKTVMRNDAPDYLFSTRDFEYMANVCRPTIMYCNGRDDAVALQYDKNTGRCIGALGRNMTGSELLLNTTEGSRGFVTRFNGGDWDPICQRNRSVNFIFTCNENLKESVLQNVIETQPCEYEFHFYTAAACKIKFTKEDLEAVEREEASMGIHHTEGI